MRHRFFAVSPVSDSSKAERRQDGSRILYLFLLAGRLKAAPTQRQLQRRIFSQAFSAGVTEEVVTAVPAEAAPVEVRVVFSAASVAAAVDVSAVAALSVADAAALPAAFSPHSRFA